jgi:hypothetical protein
MQAVTLVTALPIIVQFPLHMLVRAEVNYLAISAGTRHDPQLHTGCTIRLLDHRTSGGGWRTCTNFRIN